MSGLVKKCCNCRVELTEARNGAAQCEKCQKNELRYGKPTTCKFCQLNAAFREQKCVYCSHSERKFGAPISCANCKLNCAFNMNGAKNIGALCRLCVMQARSNKQTSVAGVSIPPLEVASSSNKHSNKRKRHEKMGDHPSAKVGRSENMPNGENDLMQIQQLRDQISRLQSVIHEKEGIILDRDKTIATLKADKISNDKKHREQIHSLRKEREETINAIIEKHRPGKSGKKN